MSDTPDPELRRRIAAAMMNMPRLQREIFMAHRQEELSYEEIVHRTGLTVRLVERHLAKAIYKLAKQLDGCELSWRERWF